MVLFKPSVFLWIFYLILLIINTGILDSPTIIVNLSLSNYPSVYIQHVCMCLWIYHVFYRQCILTSYIFMSLLLFFCFYFCLLIGSLDLFTFNLVILLYLFYLFLCLLSFSPILNFCLFKNRYYLVYLSNFLCFFSYCIELYFYLLSRGLQIAS